MPINIPAALPAKNILHGENIFVMDDLRAQRQDIRPLRILLVNLMPTKIVTETQFARLLGNTPLQVDLELIMMKSHQSKNTSREHLLSFYKTFYDVQDSYFDGMIITGAPVELLPFEQVGYWQELCELMRWSRSHVHSTLHICWGAQAALYYHYGIDKQQLDEKLFGVFEHRLTEKNTTLFRGFDDVFYVPHSRHTTVSRESIAAEPRLTVLAESDRAGVFAASSYDGRQIFISGHAEYDANTLETEYRRDKDAGLSIALPENYYPNDDDSKPPVCRWRSAAHLLFSNWLNYFVYQSTPYDIETIDELP